MKFLSWVHQMVFNTTLEPEAVVTCLYGMNTPDTRPVIDTSNPKYLLGSKKICLHAPTVLTFDNPVYQQIVKENRAKQAV